MSTPRIVIRIDAQEADLYEGEALIRTYKISSAAKGLSCEKGSDCTPTGMLRIARKVGEGCAPGTVFRARVATGEIWSNDPTNPLCNSTEDLVLTRILWLEGCEPHNANTLERYIYLHGTNQPHLLGTPASHGCIRFSNSDIEELFEHVAVGTLVEIRSGR
jgi:hypothetical protein